MMKGLFISPCLAFCILRLFYQVNKSLELLYLLGVINSFFVSNNAFVLKPSLPVFNLVINLLALIFFQTKDNLFASPLHLIWVKSLPNYQLALVRGDLIYYFKNIYVMEAF